VIAGGIAIAGLIVLHGDAHPIFHQLVGGRALPALVASVLAGAATLLLVALRRFEPARYTSALAVGAIVAGWALAQSPRFLPGLTVRQAAASHDTQVAVLVAIIAGAAILFPSLLTLFRLTLRGRFEAEEAPAPPTGAGPAAPARPALLARIAIALLIAGIGLTNVADAEWAHVIGAACFLAVVATGFRVALPEA